MSFHLVTERRGRQPIALARLGLDRPRLARVDGLEFVRLLGTGRGTDTGPSIDPARTAMFALWRGERDLERFLASHAIARRWERAGEAWHVRLLAVRAHGRWGDLTADALPAAGAAIADAGGPVVVLTRASIRPGATREFVRSSRSFGAAAGSAPGCRAVVGVGERPVGRLGTVSVWDSSTAAGAFAHEHADHVAAMGAARAGRWFREELFATFAPTGASGTWSGHDPLALP